MRVCECRSSRGWGTFDFARMSYKRHVDSEIQSRTWDTNGAKAGQQWAWYSSRFIWMHCTGLNRKTCCLHLIVYSSLATETACTKPCSSSEIIRQLEYETVRQLVH